MFNLDGRTLGRYRLIEKAGVGGMAQVYKAYQPDLDRYVAVKILHPRLTADEDFSARFRREARSIAALEHPHIVRVYDFDTEEDVAFLVMEYLEGTSLGERLRDLDCRGEVMPLEEVARIVDSLAAALDHAHARGTIHRDLKPSNVMITSEERIVLTDFGLARMIDATTVTGNGGTLGTPAYMSPEQGMGEPGNARSDIYSLGVLLYQLVTGQVPFDANTPYAVILKHITAPLPSPRSIRPELPEAIERVIFKAMAKEPDDRFETAGELAQALHLALATSADHQLPSPTASWSWRSARRWVLATAAVLAVVALALVLPSLLQSRPPTPATTGAPVTLALSGPELTSDTWIDPDTPDEVWHTTDLVHLQGPLTPDRVLLRFDLTELPTAAKIMSATLTLQVELWGDQSLPGAAVVYRILTPWEAAGATYNVPWTTPGMAAGIDYDATPLDMAPAPDVGSLTFDVTAAVARWIEHGEPNHGFAVMMSADSHNQAHHWVYLSEQPAAGDRPTLRITYEAEP